ncbi:MAG: TetR/AcrR family transcriptional regulator [Nocardioides sp.]|uniref:TetR/AcrR family transcriptional regulator n=1 Tax=Nocardioides sp. TaxID=35761 RepID=UPI0039E58481
MAKARGKKTTTSAPVKRDPDATKAALLKSALTLFEKKGYDATSVQQIVDDAGRTKGAFYHYYESKEDLLHELHDTFIDYQLELAHAVLARDEPADVLLAAMVSEALMEPLARYKSEISVFLHEQRFFSEKQFAEIRAKRDEFEGCVVEVIRRGIDSGIFKDVGSPRLIAFGVIGMCAWSHTWMSQSGQYTPRKIGEMFGEVLVSGLRA